MDSVTNGELDDVMKLIQAAKDLGADAVKIQAYTPDEMTIDKPYEDFIVKESPWRHEHLYDLYKKTYTPLEWLPGLFGFASTLNISIFASVFGEQSLAALEAVNCPAYKIASFELNDTNLIRMVAEKGKPMVLSTGVATSEEIRRALRITEDHQGGVEKTILMHCISKYPAKLSSTEMSKVINYIRYYDLPVGFSDHTINSKAAQIAITLGATVIEKHLCINTKSEDGSFSCLPYEFSGYVQDCSDTLKALEIKDEEPDRQFKRSLYVVKGIKVGEQFTKENIRSIRPGYGLDPDKLTDIIGTRASCDLPAGTALKEEHTK